jgi:glutamate formiminotransferase/formiminotetrahydrofolate cyclodeaminase
MQNALIECVPNFSEGKNRATIEAIVEAIKSVEGVQLLHVDVGAAANRTVVTFVGAPEAVVEGAFRGIEKASMLIDMQQHKGTHPRIGATDVCPLVPIHNISLEEVAVWAKILGQRVAAALNIPVFLYEAAATAPHRKNLAAIRKGAYEGLRDKMAQLQWKPDFGDAFNAKSGATVIGARPFLIAYNVNLNTTSVEIAREIAAEIRTSGQIINGIQVLGQLKCLKAIGWYIEEYGKAQVSMNLTDFSITGMHHAFEACKASAEAKSVSITGSELIGLVPLAALLDAGKFYASSHSYTESECIAWAIHHLGLNELAPFSAKERVIEYLITKELF